MKKFKTIAIIAVITFIVSGFTASGIERKASGGNETASE